MDLPLSITLGTKKWPRRSYSEIGRRHDRGYGQDQCGLADVANSIKGGIYPIRNPIPRTSPISQIATMGHTPLQTATHSLLSDFRECKPSLKLVSHFSTTQPVHLQHDYIHTDEPMAFAGLGAVRSYFDLLALNWTRDEVTCEGLVMDPEELRVAFQGSIQWKWRISKRTWRERFMCTIEFDEKLKVKSFVVETHPPKATCVMHAVDATSAK